MLQLIDRFPISSILTFLTASVGSKGAALHTANQIADLAYTVVGIVFLLLSILVLIKRQFRCPPQPVKVDE